MIKLILIIAISQLRTTLAEIHMLTNDSSNLMNNENSNPNSDQILYFRLEELYNNVSFMREIYMFFGTLITVIGSILNILCIIIFCKSKIFRNSSFPIYVYVISIVDTVNLFMRFAVPQLIEKTIRSILEYKYNVNPKEINQDKYDLYTSYITSDYHCSVFIYIYNSFTLVSVWLMVAVSLERLLVIKFALQSKYMIKLRAFLILSFIFVAIFSLNIFDLAPGFYIKPQWYANLTLLCERDDTVNSENNASRIYKRLGSLTFNTDTFALMRTLLQSIVPFLVVLIFNSLIIHNFKKIKLAARGRGKSNSCVSVNSLSAIGSITNHKHGRVHLKSARRSVPTLNTHINSHNESNNHISNRSRLQIPNHRSQVEFTIGSSRSPSPFNNSNISMPNTPVTPTSLVSALNLVPNEPNMKNTNNLFLMPPDQMNLSATPSIGTNNSSANLSVATNTNLTTTTCVNNQAQSLNSGNVNCSNSSTDKLSFMITSMIPVTKKNVGTTTTISTSRVSFKRRANKIRLNRETDIMLIVLSFSILLSQLPCTIASYLIYYQNIFEKIKDIYFDVMTLYFNAKTPMLLYIIRLLEMCYFSLNFLFYITLSPSLRKELKKNIPKKIRYYYGLFLKYLCNKNTLAKINSNQTQTKILNSNNMPNNHINNNNNNNNNNDSYNDYLGKIRSISPLSRPNFLIKSPYELNDLKKDDLDKRDKKLNKNDNRNDKKFFFELFNRLKKSNEKHIKIEKNIKKNILNQNKQEQIEQIEKKDEQEQRQTNEDLTEKNLLLNKSNKIKIIIDNLYDEEEELKLDDDLITPNEQSFLSQFNYSSPSFLNELDIKQCETQSLSIDQTKQLDYL